MLNDEPKVSFLTRMRLFQKAAVAIFVIFMAIMGTVTIIAYIRPSGSTQQDMAKAQLVRREAAYRNHQE